MPNASVAMDSSSSLALIEAIPQTRPEQTAEAEFLGPVALTYLVVCALWFVARRLRPSDRRRGLLDQDQRLDPDSAADLDVPDTCQAAAIRPRG